MMFVKFAPFSIETYLLKHVCADGDFFQVFAAAGSVDESAGAFMENGKKEVALELFDSETGRALRRVAGPSSEEDPSSMEHQDWVIAFFTLIVNCNQL
jgi:hypothetical protein